MRSGPTGSELIYLDASALVKLVLPEAESTVLSEWLTPYGQRVASVLAAVELRRAIRRASAAAAAEADVEARDLALARAEAVLAGIDLVPISDEIVMRASALEPPTLRALDALHLATALHIGSLEGMVTYDPRLAAAAATHGVAVFTPGR